VPTIFVSAWAVCGASTVGPPEEETMKGLQCWISWHTYTPKHAPDTEGWYLECRRCGKQVDTLNRGAGPLFSGFGPPG
jgi:hypothetical protein